MCKEKVLLLGGSGFLGRNIANELLGKGYIVGIYDRVSCDVPNVFLYDRDINTDDSLHTIVQQYDVIIYLISSGVPQLSMESPLDYYCNEIRNVIKVLDVCKSNNIIRVIFASSGGTVYGDSDKPNLEDNIEVPKSHYGICKLMCEKIFLLYNNVYGMDNIILRLSNVYGDYFKANSNVGAINIFIQRIINKNSVVIYGNDEIVRDYIDVKKVAEVFCNAIEWNNTDEILPVFNIGSGVGISLKQLITMLSEELQKTVRVEYGYGREWDVKKNILNISKAKKYLDLNFDRTAEDNIRYFISKSMRKYKE